MDERTFLNEKALGQDAHRKMGDLEFSFLQDSYVRPELVEQFATEAAKDIESIAANARTKEEKASIILRFLNAPDLLQSISRQKYKLDYYRAGSTTNPEVWILVWDEGGRPRTTEVTLDEIETALAPIRDRVLQHLEGRDISIHALTSKYAKSKNIFYLNDRRLLKLSRYSTEEGYEEYKAGKIEALRELYSLPRHPNILYTILELDPNNVQEQIQEEIKFETLEDLLTKTDLIDLLKYFKDILHALIFLVENKLRLTDLTLENMAVHEGTCKLFDFDALSKEGFPTIYIYGTGHQVPPERMDWNPITETEMVFDLGYALNNLLRSTKKTPTLMPIREKLMSLRDTMTRDDYERRPLLKTVLKNLEEIIKTYKPNK